MTSVRHISLKEGHEITIAIDNIVANVNSTASFRFSDHYGTLGACSPPSIPIDQIVFDVDVIRSVSPNTRAWTVMDLAFTHDDIV